MLLSGENLGLKLRAILETRLDLYEVFTDTVNQVAEGEVSINVLIEAIEYASIRLSREEKRGRRH